MPDVSKRMLASCSASAPSSPLSPSSGFAPAAPSRRVRSTDGVATLIESACARREHEALASAFSPLFPSETPWSAIQDLPPHAAKRFAPQLTAIASAVTQYRAGLTATAGSLQRWLDASEEDIRELAMRFAQYQLPGLQKLAWAERMLGVQIPGENLTGQLARLSDARFWRRAIRTILLREREHFYLRLRLVGKTAECYVSDAQLSTRLAQLKRQAAWMQETVLVPRYLYPGDPRQELLTLADVAGDARTRFAKTYTFIKAMEALATENGLTSAMVTLTAPPEWHPNPSHGVNSWNGENPRTAHRHIAEGWQAIQVELYKRGIGISGLRVVEPHQDGCPHWHVWLIYRPDVEPDILAAVMRQFPGKLKLRAPSRRGQRVNPLDVMFDSRDDVLAGTGRPLTHPKEGAQVEVSRIDPSISSGATYAMKYLLKTVDGGEPLNREVDLFGDVSVVVSGDDEASEQAAKRKAHQKTAQRVDAWRSLWGINAGMLFGVARCLTAWDELRRVTTRPTDGRLFRLWVLARGTDKEGPIPAGSEHRGDAKGFLEALGGLTAARDPRRKSLLPPLRLARLTESAENAYGEAVQRPKGLQLIESKRVAVPTTGARKPRTNWKTVKTVVATVVTRTQQWTLVRKDRAAQAVAQAEAAMLAWLHEDSPAERGRRAVQHFWSVCHDAAAAMADEPTDWRLPIPPPVEPATA